MMIALSLIVWTIRTIPMRHRIAIAVMFVIAVAGAVTLVPATSWKRLASAASEVSEGTLNSRTVLWKAGLREFQYMPFGGVGAGIGSGCSCHFIFFGIVIQNAAYFRK